MSPLEGLASATATAGSEPIIEITPAALVKLVELRDAEPDADKLGLRLEIASGPGEDFRYDLSFDEYLTAAFTDEVRTHDGLKVIIPQRDLDRLQGATLDHTETQGLVIRNPNRPAAPVIEGLTSDDELSAEIEALVATRGQPGAGRPRRLRHLRRPRRRGHRLPDDGRRLPRLLDEPADDARRRADDARARPSTASSGSRTSPTTPPARTPTTADRPAAGAATGSDGVGSGRTTALPTTRRSISSRRAPADCVERELGRHRGLIRPVGEHVDQLVDERPLLVRAARAVLAVEHADDRAPLEQRQVQRDARDVAGGEADDEEAALPRRAAQRRLAQGAADRVVDDVDALAAGVLLEPRLEVDVGVVDGLGGAEPRGTPRASPPTTRRR